MFHKSLQQLRLTKYLLCTKTCTRCFVCLANSHFYNNPMSSLLTKKLRFREIPKVALKKKKRLLIQNILVRNLSKNQANLPSLAKLSKNKRLLGRGSQISNMNNLSTDAI